MKKTFSELKKEKVMKEIWVSRRAVKLVHKMGWAWVYEIYATKKVAKEAATWADTEFVGKYKLEEK